MRVMRVYSGTEKKRNVKNLYKIFNSVFKRKPPPPQMSFRRLIALPRKRVCCVYHSILVLVYDEKTALVYSKVYYTTVV